VGLGDPDRLDQGSLIEQVPLDELETIRGFAIRSLVMVLERRVIPTTRYPF
jgi:hypothetical protein